MKQRLLNDKLIAELADKINLSDRKEKYLKYIKEVAEKCVKLCDCGEGVRVLSEFKFMTENLRKDLGI